MKTHKLVSLGVVASAAALVATGIGTYSYFSDSKTANTNITLNKGTVKLGDVTDPNWVYLGNTSKVGTVSSGTDTSVSTYNIGSLSDLSDMDPYTGKYVNPDLKVNSQNVDAWNVKLVGTNFGQIVPGDTFRKKITFTYSGDNSADLSMKLVWNHSSEENTKWKNFNNSFDYIVVYSVTDTKTVKASGNLVTNISGISSIGYPSIVNNGVALQNVQLKKDDKITITYTVRMKTSDYNDVAQFGDNSGKNYILPQEQLSSTFTTKDGKNIYDGIELTVKNHLEKK